MTLKEQIDHTVFMGSKMPRFNRKFFKPRSVRNVFIRLTCIYVFLLTATAYGAPLGPHRSLRKMSRHLRMGLDPSRQEQAELQGIINQSGHSSIEVKNFLDKKADAYVESKEFQNGMLHKVQNLFRLTSFVLDNTGLPVTSTPSYADPLSLAKPVDQLRGSTYGVIKEVLQENKSWDYLLTGSNFYAVDKLSFFDPKGTTKITETGFYGSVLPVAVATDGGNLKFKTDEERVAGILTSAQFRARYFAGKTNENRRIAQSVFRAFLCDDLQPAFVPSSDENNDNVKILNQLISKLKGSGTPPSPDEIKNIMDANNIKHGSEASCMACHAKLDPLGQAFGIPGDKNLAADPSIGALVLYRNGQPVRFPSAGIGNLTRVLVLQPEYNQCQTKNFWDWFIGTEVPLSDRRKSDLTDIFTGKKLVGGMSIAKNHRKFAAYLTKQPEFQIDVKTLDPNSPEAMSTVLQTCNRCHAVAGAPTFVSRPFGGDEASDTRIVAALKYRVLDVPISSNQSMPPNRPAWSEADLRRLEVWVRGLKPLDQGVPQ